MDVTKPYKFIGFGPLRDPFDVPTPLCIGVHAGRALGGHWNRRSCTKLLGEPPEGLRQSLKVLYATQYCFRAGNRPSGPDFGRTATGKTLLPGQNQLSIVAKGRLRMTGVGDPIPHPVHLARRLTRHLRTADQPSRPGLSRRLALLALQEVLNLLFFEKAVLESSDLGVPAAPAGRTDLPILKIGNKLNNDRSAQKGELLLRVFFRRFNILVNFVGVRPEKTVQKGGLPRTWLFGQVFF